MSTNADRRNLIQRHQELARELYFAKYPNNGKTVKSYWVKCQREAAKRLGLI